MNHHRESSKAVFFINPPRFAASSPTHRRVFDRSPMSEKRDCGHRDGDCERRRWYRRLFAGFLFLIVLVLIVFLIVWLVLRPTRPRFYLQDASIVQLNLTAGSGLLTSVLQVTISSRNPNDRIGIYYDRLVVYARYQGQQITNSLMLPTGYQGHNDVTVWSPYLFGPAVPLPPDLAAALYQDQHAGYVFLSVRIDGRLRWKVGTWISRRYHIHVNCPAFLVLDSSKPYAPDAGSYFYRFQFQQYARCSVDI
ncbi:NDR1/HIN1-like protein 1 [Curcuma longa]|uniref:NDR1/HIN1-like protein 1 n=1 Tax=Curcuma longa TaxID=136217 RepID=UPI003D9E7A58